MDYSPYKFTYFPKEIKNKRVKDKKIVGKKGSKFNAFLIVIILLSLIVSLVLIGKYTGRDLITETTTNLIKKDNLVYYIVCLNPTEYKTDAEALSRKVRYSGGAGYVINQNNAYYVSLATYIEEKSAKDVCAKNDNTTYLTFTFDRKEYLSKVTDDGITKRILAGVEEGVGELIEVTFLYEKKELTFQEATHRVEGVRSELIKLKMEILDQAKTKEQEELIAFVDPLLSALNILDEEKFTSTVRYAVCAWVNQLN